MADKPASRSRLFWNCINPYLKSLFTLYTLLGALTWTRDELFPTYKDNHLFDYLPDWPWYLWVSVLALILAVALVEGWYQQTKLHQGNAGSVLDASGKIYKRVPKRRWFTAGLPILLVIGTALLYVAPPKWFTREVASITPKATEPQILTTKPKDPPVPLSSVSLSMRSDIGGIPFDVPPKTTWYVMPLKPEMNRWLLPVTNLSDKPLRWPEKGAIKGKFPFVQAMVFKLTSYSEKTLLSVTMDVNTDFAEAIIKKRPDGKGEDITTGKEVFKGRHRISIGELRPQETATIILVNGSRLWANYSAPTLAQVHVAGEATPRNIPIARPDVTVLDALPGLPFPPFPDRLTWGQLGIVNTGGG